MRKLLQHGALAGLAGGLVLAVFLRLVGEGPIRDAIALEEADIVGTPGHVHDELFTRAAQELGGMLGAALYGVLLGVVVAVVFAAVRHRLPLRDDWRRALAVATAGFFTVALVPALKYPGNPPAVGDPDTVGRRTALWLLFLGWSIVSTWGAWRLLRWLRARGWDEPTRVPAALMTYLGIVGLGFALFPGSPDPVKAPATLVWQFRVATIAGAALLWAALGLVLGALLVRRPLDDGSSATGHGSVTELQREGQFR